MSTADEFLAAAKSRRSMYNLSATTTISDSRIRDIVETAVKHAPSSYNVQSARAVIMLKEQHLRLWQVVAQHMTVALASLDAAVQKRVSERIEGYRGSYGTVLWFEDEVALEKLKEKNPMAVPMLTEWSDHSNGMHQFIVWTALELEGLGASLQHFNFHPDIKAEITSTWKFPESWKLKAQLVFGQPSGAPPADKTFEPIEQRVLMMT